MKVSIVVPVYNVDKYLCQCLDSLCHQTLKEIEIICVDDGSTDLSGKILDEYANKDERIRVIHKQNEGYGKAMNCGIDHAKGEYIGILESDDFANIDMYEKLYSKATESNLDMIRGNYFEYRESGIKEHILYPLELCDKLLDPLDIPTIFLQGPAIWTGLYKREFLKEKNIRFQETPGASYQDASYHFLTWTLAERIAVTEDCLMYYRMDNEASSVHSKKKIFCVCDEFAFLERKLQEAGVCKEFLYANQGYKFSKYLWNFRRLSIKYQYIFYKEMVRQFELAREDGLLKKEYWDMEFWKILEPMLSDPEAYYDKISKRELDFIPKAENRYTYRAAKIGLVTAMKQNKLYLYGAGIVASRMIDLLRAEGITDLELIVSKMDGNPTEVKGIKVRVLDDITLQGEELIVVAVADKNRADIVYNLRKQKIKNIMILDDLFWSIWNEGRI